MRLNDVSREPPMSGSTSGRPWQPGSLASAQRDLYEMWREVFNSARPLCDDGTGAESPRDTATDPGLAREARWRSPYGSATQAHHDGSCAGEVRAPLGEVTSTPALWVAGVASLAPARVSIDVCTADPELEPMRMAASEPRVRMPPYAFAPEASSVSTSPRPWNPVQTADSAPTPCNDDGAAAPAGVLRATAASADLPSAPTDSVSVFRQGESVVITVRDAVISADLAVRCALETAHQLTGERRALRQVTLNGKTVYERPAFADAAAAGTKQRLVFAC